MKVLKEVNIDSWTCIQKCYYCFSELEINADDIQLDSQYDELYCACPICKETNAFESSEIPYNIRVKLEGI